MIMAQCTAHSLLYSSMAVLGHRIPGPSMSCHESLAPGVEARNKFYCVDFLLISKITVFWAGSWFGQF